MKLHTCFVTYNRLELTKQAITSYLETVSVPFSLWVVDNASQDGTREWVSENVVEVGTGYTFFRENHYPGRAANEGWGAVEFTEIAADATHLHRADNDFIFLDDWCSEVERMFASNENLGQLGLRTDAEEARQKINVGGNCVIRRELWDRGLRWDERTWPQLRDEVGPGWTEDSLMSKSVKKMQMLDPAKGHYTWDRVERPCIQELEPRDLDSPYYQAAWAARYGDS